MMMMSKLVRINPKKENMCESESELRRGPWTLEEDNLLIHHVTSHGEGRWNSLAKFAGLKRTGKSCRLRWLNYLKPDIKRGNLTPHEQLFILELHSKFGNRWSKIAQHLPGRTDNEIKNYWRTRVQKQAKQLKIDSNSTKFLETIRAFWIPRLIDKTEQKSSTTSSSSSSSSSISTVEPRITAPSPLSTNMDMVNNSDTNNIPELKVSQYENLTTGKIHEYENQVEYNNYYHVAGYDMQEVGSQDISLSGCHVVGSDWFGDDLGTTFWNTDELWPFRKSDEVGL
ncbi:hypothetical protein ACS0TY_008343 [Phlomoides rotata]